MANFKEFYKKSEQLSKNVNQENSGAIESGISNNIQQILLPMIGISSVFTNAEKVEKFSKEVANYTTNDEVLSTISEQIGEPKEDESEQEFVERASHLLREILKKKFKV